MARTKGSARKTPTETTRLNASENIPVVKIIGENVILPLQAFDQMQEWLIADGHRLPFTIEQAQLGYARTLKTEHLKTMAAGSTA